MRHFRFTLLPVLIGSDYVVFLFLLGVGTQPVGTLPLCSRFAVSSEVVTHTFRFGKKHFLSTRLDKIRSDV